MIVLRRGWFATLGFYALFLTHRREFLNVQVGDGEIRVQSKVTGELDMLMETAVFSTVPDTHIQISMVLNGCMFDQPQAFFSLRISFLNLSFEREKPCRPQETLSSFHVKPKNHMAERVAANAICLIFIHPYHIRELLGLRQAVPYQS